MNGAQDKNCLFSQKITCSRGFRLKNLNRFKLWVSNKISNTDNQKSLSIKNMCKRYFLKRNKSNYHLITTSETIAKLSRQATDKNFRKYSSPRTKLLP